MSDLYEARLIEKAGTTATIHLTVIHADVVWIPAKKNFALQLLWHAAAVSPFEDNALAADFSPDDIADIYYTTAKESDYIESVSVLETNGERPPAAPESVFRDEDNPAPFYAVLEIVVTKPKWLEHVEDGFTWASTAYDMERDM